MAQTNPFEILSDLQTMQDLLSEQFNMFFVLLADNYNEITLPSKLPLLCYDNASADIRCANCTSNCVKNYQANTDNTKIIRCHHNLHLNVFKTNIQYKQQIYLIAGRTQNDSLLKKSMPFFQTLFGLPIVINSVDNTLYPNIKIPTVSKNLYGLTQQELNILSCLVNGLTNQDIATKMCISLSTVKTHIAHILSKLNASNRTEASIFALQNGLLEILKNGNR